VNSPAPLKCLIALGSNLGDRRSHLQFAVDAITKVQNTKITAISGLYQTAPVGGPRNQGAYFNAALLAHSTLSAEKLLSFLQDIESQRQRERHVRWGPRTLDLDLLTYGSAIRNEDNLTLPHAHMHERRFVMAPVCDIAPDFTHPRLGQSMQLILSTLPIKKNDLVLIERTWWTSET